MISGFRCEVAKNCALLGYYSVGSGNFFITTHCVLTQKSGVLIVNDEMEY